MARPTDQEMTALKKRVCSSQIPRGGTHRTMGSHMQKRRAQSGGRGIKGKMWARAFIVRDQEQVWQGMQAADQLV